MLHFDKPNLVKLFNNLCKHKEYYPHEGVNCSFDWHSCRDCALRIVSAINESGFKRDLCWFMWHGSDDV